MKNSASANGSTTFILSQLLCFGTLGVSKFPRERAHTGRTFRWSSSKICFLSTTDREPETRSPSSSPSPVHLFSKDLYCPVIFLRDETDIIFLIQNWYDHGISSIPWEMGELMELVGDIQLEEGRDRVCWSHTEKGLFTTGSMYRIFFFLGGGVKDVEMGEVWKSRIPLKIKHFIHLVGRGRPICTEQLVKRKWKRGCWGRGEG